MSLCQVLQIYTDHTDGVWSNEKPALCFRGHKWTHCVVIGYPVHVVRRPGRDFEVLRPTQYEGKAYPAEKMAVHLRKAGRHNGITVAARRLLETMADGRATFPLAEDELHLTEEDDMMLETTQPAEAGEDKPKENPVAAKKTKAPAKGPKKQTKPAKVKVTKPAKPTVTKGEKKAKPAKAAKADKAPRAPGIGAMMRELIKAGKDNQQVLDAVKKKFPDSVAQKTSVAWHRSQMKKK